jgi:phosphoglycerate dehydrogenase-like enzyme
MAAVDVFEDEPLTDVGHPLLRVDNVVCRPIETAPASERRGRAASLVVAPPAVSSDRLSPVAAAVRLPPPLDPDVGCEPLP